MILHLAFYFYAFFLVNHKTPKFIQLKITGLLCKKHRFCHLAHFVLSVRVNFCDCNFLNLYFFISFCIADFFSCILLPTCFNPSPKGYMHHISSIYFPYRERGSLNGIAYQYTFNVQNIPYNHFCICVGGNWPCLIALCCLCFQHR